jgi:hypothetical protein
MTVVDSADDTLMLGVNASEYTQLIGRDRKGFNEFFREGRK